MTSVDSAHYGEPVIVRQQATCRVFDPRPAWAYLTSLEWIGAKGLLGPEVGVMPVGGR